MTTSLIPSNWAPRLGLRKVKQFRGMDGIGLNAELLLDGQPVAQVLDEGSGGEMMFEWRDRSDEEVYKYITELKLQPTLEADDQENLNDADQYKPCELDCPVCKGKASEFMGEPRPTPPYYEGLRRFDHFYCFTCKARLWAAWPDLPSIVNRIVDAAEVLRKLKRHCAKKTLFVVAGDADGVYHEAPVPYTPAVAKRLREKYGEKLVEILNERFLKVRAA